MSYITSELSWENRRLSSCLTSFVPVGSLPAPLSLIVQFPPSSTVPVLRLRPGTSSISGGLTQPPNLHPTLSLVSKTDPKKNPFTCAPQVHPTQARLYGRSVRPTVPPSTSLPRPRVSFRSDLHLCTLGVPTPSNGTLTSTRGSCRDRQTYLLEPFYESLVFHRPRHPPFGLTYDRIFVFFFHKVTKILVLH